MPLRSVENQLRTNVEPSLAWSLNVSLLQIRPWLPYPASCRCFCNKALCRCSQTFLAAVSGIRESLTSHGATCATFHSPLHVVLGICSGQQRAFRTGVEVQLRQC